MMFKYLQKNIQDEIDNVEIARLTCPYCNSDNKAIRETFFDQNCEACVRRMCK